MNENENVREEERTTPPAEEVSASAAPSAAADGAGETDGTQVSADAIPSADGGEGEHADGADLTPAPDAPPKKVYVNAPPKKKEKDENRVRWGREILSAFGLIGRVILRMFSPLTLMLPASVS